MVGFAGWSDASEEIHNLLFLFVGQTFLAVDLAEQFLDSLLSGAVSPDDNRLIQLPLFHLASGQSRDVTSIQNVFINSCEVIEVVGVEGFQVKHRDLLVLDTEGGCGDIVIEHLAYIEEQTSRLVFVPPHTHVPALL